jgi:hypothetical protein
MYAYVYIHSICMHEKNGENTQKFVESIFWGGGLDSQETVAFLFFL